MSSIQSIDRMFHILETIAKNQNGIGISELSQETDLHKSTVHRLVASLVENGYIEQMDNSKYKISYKLYEIGSSILADVNITDASREVISKLADEVDEVVHLVVRNHNEIIYIDKENANSNSSIMGSTIGSSAPMYCTSVGKAMLFDATDYEIKDVWNRTLILEKTHNTITSLEEFVKDVKISKSRGYAIDNEENELGVRCVGAPIYDYKKKIVAAISISGPTNRVTEENLSKYYGPLIEAANEISKKMGYLENA